MPDVLMTLHESFQAAKAAMQIERYKDALARQEKSVPENWPGWVTVYVEGAGTYTLPQDKYTFLKEGFRNWNYTATTLIIDHITGLAWYLYKGKPKSKDDISKPIEASPFLDWIANPNENESLREFLERTILHYELTGEFYWHIERNARGMILSLKLLRPDWMRPVTGNNVLTGPGSLIGWRYRALGNSGEGELLPRQDVIHKFKPHPFAILQGYSPISANLYTIQMDADIRIHEQAFFKNGARPDYLLNIEGGLSPEQKKYVEAQLHERHGGPSGAHKPMVVGGAKATLTPVSLSNKDQQFKDLAEWVFKNIFLSKGIPLGILEPQSSRAHAYQADKVFNKWCISPRLTILGEALSEVAQQFDKQYLVKYENIIPRDAEFELEENRAYLQEGVYSVNEVRAWKGLKPFKGEEYDIPKKPAAPAGLFGASTPLPSSRKALQSKDDGNERRSKIWYAYAAKAGKKETLLRQAVNSAFDWDRKEIKARIKSGKAMMKGAGDYFPLADEWREAWEKFLRNSAKGIYGDFAQAGIEDLGIGLDFDLSNPNIQAQFDKLLNQGIEELTGTSRDKLKTALEEAIGRGADHKELAQIVDETIDGWKAGTSRAYTIARTETTKLSNAGAFAGWDQIKTDLGRKIIKEWITTRDGRERETHADADGQERDSEDLFDIGGSRLMYPGDGMFADAGEVINCRCTMGARLADEGE